MSKDISVLVGKTLAKVEQVGVEQIRFTDSEGTEYVMYHESECCESVTIEDVTGDLQDLVGSPIIRAEESSNNDNPKVSHDNSWTWTFYRLATKKGTVVIRWYGESNGYYSEGVTFS